MGMAKFFVIGFFFLALVTCMDTEFYCGMCPYWDSAYSCDDVRLGFSLLSNACCLQMAYFMKMIQANTSQLT